MLQETVGVLAKKQSTSTSESENVNVFNSLLCMHVPEICLFHIPPTLLLLRKKNQFSYHFVMIAFSNLMGFLTKGKPAFSPSQRFQELSREAC